LAELKEYARCEQIPADAASVELTISYLSALNNLFERSIIGKKVRVFDVNGRTIQRMGEGFNFFADWAKENHEGDDKKSFLAWQVTQC
jgi:hypothetical protein